MGAKKYADSEPMLLTGYKGMTQVATTIPKNSQFRVTETLDQLVQFYTSWHATDPTQCYDLDDAHVAMPAAEAENCRPERRSDRRVEAVPKLDEIACTHKPVAVEVEDVVDTVEGLAE
jgi:hypothetical protein